LTSIINRFGFVCDRRHRAYDDAHVLWQFYQHIQTHISEEALKIATNRVQKRPTIPQHLDPQEVDDLPESHGVYFFYDMDNILLYIGKANNIRARVLSHFSNDNSSAKELAMCPQIARVEYVETAGELGALLRESNYIKTMQPLYNRLMRNKKKLNIVKESVNEHGYKTATMKQVDSITVADLETIIGVFKSKKHGLTKLSEISEKHKLCKKLLSVESGKGPCFDYHLQLCNGACIQKEIPLKYNMRMTLARAENRLRPWLYDSAIEVIEKSNDTMRVERFIIDQWCVIESNTNNGDSSLPTGYIFDMDTYTILNRYFKSRTKNTIHSLKQDNTPVRNAKPVHIP
jgi:DNA polymerase-3 subunit epsilon